MCLFTARHQPPTSPTGYGAEFWQRLFLALYKNEHRRTDMGSGRPDHLLAGGNGLRQQAQLFFIRIFILFFKPGCVLWRMKFTDGRLFLITGGKGNAIENHRF
ncbi:MAG: hypothetical protein PSU89_09420 [Methylobacter sp.]|nr:hypothetical protein [Methylobacter sp.]